MPYFFLLYLISEFIGKLLFWELLLWITMFALNHVWLRMRLSWPSLCNSFDHSTTFLVHTVEEVRAEAEAVR